jgi:hypothetical protein
MKRKTAEVEKKGAGNRKLRVRRKNSFFLLTSVFCLLTPAFSEAATKILLKDPVSALGAQAATGYGGYGCNSYSGAHVLRLASTTQGSSTVSTSQAPTSTAPPCQFGSESGATYLRFVTPPIASGFTLSGNMDYSIGCRESATQMNAGVGMAVYRYSKAAGGIVSTIHTSANSTECPTTAGLRTIAAAAPTSTTMAAGDRIVFVVEIRAAGGWGGNGARSVELHYDGAAASAGDTFANFADNFSFNSDTNDGRVILTLRDALRRALGAMLPLDFARPRPAERIP